MDKDAGFVGTFVLARSGLHRGQFRCDVQQKSRTCRAKRWRMAVAEAASGSSEASEAKDAKSSSTIHQMGGQSHGDAKEFRDKFEVERGKEIVPVSVAMSQFQNEFARPVPIVYRSIVNETLMTTHLARVCPMWRYDEVFAFGYMQIFDEFLKFYPAEDEKERLFHAMSKALKFDEKKLRKDGDAVKRWIVGKSESDVFKLVEEGGDTSSPIYSAFSYLQNAGRFDWYYSRLFGIGLIKIMEAVGVKLTNENAEKWANKLKVPKGKFASEMAAYLSIVERLKQAEQIFAEASAREARKVAERLAEKAAKAKEEANKGIEEAGVGVRGEASAGGTTGDKTEI
eukprot:Plantae.Rhodophyta-Hildenbrandia_rubra.ctg747.p1 GENE.Plantae.Rhodophyta-Hildenbrandia_rubra.ctg747~~Plantae.Rhodophyta-Hildenbrandia_rubra.ctg747.p1  ORF type:complete len:341 (+),score=89.29 Plantae.Rhodophyta-Hildenbrandia_rubra.ctg747:182-1204(+)